MKTIFYLLSAILIFSTITISYAQTTEEPSFFERLAHNYGDPKNWIIGAVIGLAIAIIAMLKKKKK